MPLCGPQLGIPALQRVCSYTIRRTQYDRLSLQQMYLLHNQKKMAPLVHGLTPGVTIIIMQHAPAGTSLF